MGGERRATIDVYKTQVGFGHGYFTESVLSHVDRDRYNVAIHTPSDYSPLTRAAWEALKMRYQSGGQSEEDAIRYRKLRETVGRFWPANYVLSLEARLRHDFNNSALADHALFTVNGATLMQFDVWVEKLYVHTGAGRVVVPLAKTAKLFQNYGLDSDKLVVAGFPVNPALKDETCRIKIIDQMKDGKSSVAFVATGANSPIHYEYVDRVLLPGLTPLVKQGRINFSIFTGLDAGKAIYYADIFRKLGIDSVVNGNFDQSAVHVVYGKSYDDAQEKMIEVCLANGIIVGMIGEKTGMAGLRCLVPLFATSANAHFNQVWLAENEYAPPVDFSATFPENLTEELKTGCRSYLEQLKRAYEKVPRNGSETVANIITAEAKRK